MIEGRRAVLQIRCTAEGRLPGAKMLVFKEVIELVEKRTTPTAAATASKTMFP